MGIDRNIAIRKIKTMPNIVNHQVSEQIHDRYLHGCNIQLDGKLTLISTYEKSGFKTLRINNRYTMIISKTEIPDRNIYPTS